MARKMRLIDADETVEHAWRDRLDSRERIAQMIENMPTIDAVPVIRCKDCKYYMGNWYCEAWNNSPGFPAVDGNMFCSMGERKDETD